jgi:hypothetical protein
MQRENASDTSRGVDAVVVVEALVPVVVVVELSCATWLPGELPQPAANTETPISPANAESRKRRELQTKAAVGVTLSMIARPDNSPRRRR